MDPKDDFFDITKYCGFESWGDQTCLIDPSILKDGFIGGTNDDPSDEGPGGWSGGW